MDGRPGGDADGLLRLGAAAGEQQPEQGERPDPAEDAQRTATIASTSTAIPAGSSETPIALRAQRPRSSP